MSSAFLPSPVLSSCYRRCRLPKISGEPPRAQAVLARTRKANGATSASDTQQNTQPTKKKRGRKTGAEIERARSVREKYRTRTPLIAKWAGVVLARSPDYEFLDGRFFFPNDSINWEYFESHGVQRYQNPLGLAHYYDIVIRKGKGSRGVHRNRNAMWVFANLKPPWRVMSGYVGFWKGVNVFAGSVSEGIEINVKNEGDVFSTAAVLLPNGESDSRLEHSRVTRQRN